MNRVGKRTHARVSILRTACIWAMVLTALAAGAYASSTVRVRSAPNPSMPAQATGSETGQDPLGDDAGEPDQSVRVVKVYVTRYGFEPSAITIPPGDYLLMLSNASGEPSVMPVVRGVVRLSTGDMAESAKSGGFAPSPGPTQTVDVPVPLRSDERYAQLTGFRTGTVVIDDAAHPNWRCTITVTD